MTFPIVQELSIVVVNALLWQIWLCNDCEYQSSYWILQLVPNRWISAPLSKIIFGFCIYSLFDLMIFADLLCYGFILLLIPIDCCYLFLDMNTSTTWIGVTVGEGMHAILVVGMKELFQFGDTCWVYELGKQMNVLPNWPHIY